MDTNTILEQLTITTLNLLSIRPQSEWELRQKLERAVKRFKLDHVTGKKLIEHVLETVGQQGYVNDMSFAMWYTQQRLEFRPRSKRRLTVELSRKGIDREIINETLEHYDEPLACRRLAYKKRGYPKEKLTDYLLKEGFAWDIVEELVEENEDK